MTSFVSAIAAVVTSLVVAIPAGASGACKTTLRGELVQSPDLPLASPRKFLRLTLSEIVRGDGAYGGERRQEFQTFMIPNTMTTLPIPFTLNVDNPRDCPAELRLSAETSDKDDPMSFFTHGDFHLIGAKRVRLDEFEQIPVHSQLRRF
ncbi:hypothetical protein [Bradyrhizobium mercantei]|uniref:hypothetical protein n=1 Tax=Bradyrhizobium mercantei TaxID=1904807 RepID=UPI000975F029|nr:hypothetical protein [Bradyrhizobium mercantei]